MMQDREKIVLEMLEKIPKQSVVLIGGYAVNAYVPPRFSIDCDLVVLDDLAEVEASLKSNGFVKTESGDMIYGDYVRFLREKEKASFDLLVNAVSDRHTGVVFEKMLFEKYSKKRVTVGRATPARIEMKIADPELLFAMKFVSGRKQDIRDILMLSGEDLNWSLVVNLVSKKCEIDLVEKRIVLIKQKIESESYRDSLHGPYGKIPDERFKRCRKHLLELLEKLTQS
ncbi:MAG: hypothetical protein M1503_04795 [Thaumarchaeota archaeon]|nr:hypothetical protein [Nitrososphaerota archaeon]MCL5317569.1 hypothetical protein [Nitrososphaerota archaeon]